MKTLLLECVTAGSVKQLQVLLAQSRRIVAGGFQVPADLDVNCADRSGITPLHTAVLKGNLPMVKLLLDAGADCTRCDSLGQSPLHLAHTKQCPDIAVAITQHLTALRAKSPNSRLPLQHDTGTSTVAHASDHVTHTAADATAGSPWSRSTHHRNRHTSCASASPSGQLLRALSVSSVKRHAAPQSAALPSTSEATCHQRVGVSATSPRMNTIVEVPRDAILDFKLWMKQKQAATAPATTLPSFSEAPEFCIAEDDEVSAVNRCMLPVTAAGVRRPITPTLYGCGARAAPLTPVGSRSQSTSLASPAKTDWLHAPQQSLSSHASAPPQQPRHKLARVSSSLRTKSSHSVADELPPLPSSFLPRELDPVEAARMQRQRQLADLQQQVQAQQQQTRSMTPAAFKKLKRRILGATACCEDEPSPLAAGGDAVGGDGEAGAAAAASAAFRPKLHVGVRLRRLVL